jgi:hypothetical protein
MNDKGKVLENYRINKNVKQVGRFFDENINDENAHVVIESSSVWNLDSYVSLPLCRSIWQNSALVAMMVGAMTKYIRPSKEVWEWRRVGRWWTEAAVTRVWSVEVFTKEVWEWRRVRDTAAATGINLYFCGDTISAWNGCQHFLIRNYWTCCNYWYAKCNGTPCYKWLELQDRLKEWLQGSNASQYF